MTQFRLLQAMVMAWVQGHLTPKEERGASLVEYALLLALIAVVAIGALLFLGGAVNSTLNNVANMINNP